MRSFTGRWDICRSAGWWEPDEPRGSRPVLREAEGEIPPAYSPIHGGVWADRPAMYKYQILYYMATF
jgi:hypothetical protein